eukprot:CAMPEP_0180518778 /NCGR_PEP_ID=MMETSP1036_2-20121128/55296_1 /TAXON_ID=632150 /ORGANISM="Azadinium spinosum, Strain 3D9" /LENGTH=70 /DNA_ID=CAMNT_0022530993 /DNA_START=188 /DNA_END=400 /DNA_ORIENTATION=-
MSMSSEMMLGGSLEGNFIIPAGPPMLEYTTSWPVSSANWDSSAACKEPMDMTGWVTPDSKLRVLPMACKW